MKYWSETLNFLLALIVYIIITAIEPNWTGRIIGVIVTFIILRVLENFRKKSQAKHTEK